MVGIHPEHATYGCKTLQEGITTLTIAKFSLHTHDIVNYVYLQNPKMVAEAANMVTEFKHQGQSKQGYHATLQTKPWSRG